MDGIKKPAARELLDYYLSADILKTFVRDKLDDKAKSKEQCLELIQKHLDAREIVTLLFENFHAAHQNCHVFEVRDAKSSLSENHVKRALAGLTGGQLKRQPIIHIEKCSDGLSVQGLILSSYEGYLYNPDDEEYLSKKKEFQFTLPFKLTFLPPRHIKIRFFKFSPARAHRVSSGEVVWIKRVLFDPTEAITHLTETIVSKVSKAPVVKSNLSMGLKRLIKAHKLGAIRATAEDDGGEGINLRTKNNTQKGVLLEHSWLEKNILPSTRVLKSKWFWIADLKSIDELNGAQALTIDCGDGVCAKDRIDEDNHEWLIDELIEENDKEL